MAINGKKTGLGLMGLGVGAKLLANNLAPNSLSGFYNQEANDLAAGNHLSNDSSLENAIRVIGDYGKNGNALMNDKLFGAIPTKDFVKGMRSLPGLDEKTRWNAGSDSHYESFKSGPLHGFTTWIDERFMPDKSNKPEMLKAFRENINQYMKDNTGKDNYFQPHESGTTFVPSAPGYVSNEQQLDLMKKYPEYLARTGTPELQEAIKGEAPEVYKAYDHYKNKLIDPMNEVTGKVNNFGNMAIGAGGGGVLGAALANYLSDKKNKKRNSILGGLAGGLAGGIAGHYYE